jgi:hypothetical protein
MVEGLKAAGITGPLSVGRNDAKAPTARFSVDFGVAPSAQNTRLSTVTGIDLESMLTLQAVGPASERDKAARRRGNAMLAALKNLQQAMLAEEDPSAPLKALQELTAKGGPADDPGLDDIVRALDLRSRIEVARRQRAGARSHNGERS